MRTLILLCCLLTSLAAESYPASAHEAFRLRAQYEALLKRDVHTSGAVDPHAPVALAEQAAMAAYIKTLTEYFAAPEHRKELPRTTEDGRQADATFSLIAQRLALREPMLPRPGDVIALGYHAVKGGIHVEWMTDLCDAEYKGRHRAN